MLSPIQSHYQKVDDLKHQHACCVSWRLQTDQATPTSLLLHGPIISWPRPGVLKQQFHTSSLHQSKSQCIFQSISPCNPESRFYTMTPNILVCLLLFQLLPVCLLQFLYCHFIYSISLFSFLVLLL